ncbi:VIT domain-containing protein [Fluviicola taffensis]|uniref:VIT domain-containing protein n=1 Tax=Fluviicola taffensis TaxID=191579 RepID=UPI003137F606
MNLKKYLAPGLALVFGLSFLFYGLFSKEAPITPKKHKHAAKHANWTVEKLNLNTSLSSPALMVKNKQEISMPLNTRSLHIKTAIHGSFAETRLEIEFENENDRILEGEFYFPLGEKQLISNFQLEVNGKMREGVIVDKDLGRVAFESTVRRKVDPGLLELSKGNTFKARVYPIPAKGTKKISITYVEELTTKDGMNAYFLPLNYSGEIENYSCSISVDDLGQEILDKRNTYSLVGGQFVTRSDLKKVKLKKGIQLIQQDLDESESTIAPTEDGNYIFQTSLQPKQEKHLKSKLRSVSVLLDVSASSEKRNFEKEKALIRKYLASFKKVDVQLIVFSNAVHETSWRTILSESDITRFLEELDYQKLDGGTQLGCIAADQILGEEVLLLSDCLSNLGKESFPKLKNKRVYVISSSSEFDSRSAQLTAQNGGEFINLNENGLAESLNKLKYEQLQFLGIQGIEGKTTGIGSFADSDFRTYSKLKSLPKEFTLLFGSGGKVTKKINLKRDALRKVKSTEMLSKFWSNNYLKELDLENEKNKPEMIRLAKQNKLISRYTSLIVLDALEDYLQYRIVPPVEMRKEYYKRLKAQETPEIDSKKETKEHREMVQTRFEELIEWWRTDFEPKPVEKEEKLKTMETMDVVTSSGNANTSQGQDAAVGETVVLSDRAVSSGTYSLSATSNGATSYSWSETSNLTFQVTDVNASGFKVSDKNELEAKIELSNWDPETPYLNKLKASNQSGLYTTYLSLKKKYQNQPSFYVDVSDYFLKLGKKKEAIRILSNISELEMENPQMLRILAHRYEQMREYELAVSVFERVKKMRPEEPQSYRDLALAYELNRNYSKAFSELKYVITHSWDDRFRDIENICLVELNHLVSKHKLATGKLSKKLIWQLPVDVRVVIDWDSDNCDIDLWVTDPSGEKCDYSHQLTEAGGRISLDCTGGYGPEEFMIKKAMKGTYQIQANYYGSSAQTLSGLTTIHVKLITNYGRKNEKTQSITRRLEEQSEIIDLAEFEFE